MTNNKINGFWEESNDGLFNTGGGFFITPYQAVQINGEEIELDGEGDHPANQLIGGHNEVPHQLAAEFGLVIEE